MTEQRKNKYDKRSPILERKFREIFQYFGNDFNALKAYKITSISHCTCKVIYAKLRLHIAKFCINDDGSNGEFERDESYFGTKRVCGKRGRGTTGKTPVFGLLKRKGNVYVQVVKNCSRESLMPIIYRRKNT